MNAYVTAHDSISDNFDVAVLKIERLRVCYLAYSTIFRGENLLYYCRYSVIHSFARIVINFDIIASMNINYLPFTQAKCIGMNIDVIHRQISTGAALVTRIQADY